MGKICENYLLNLGEVGVILNQTWECRRIARGNELSQGGVAARWWAQRNWRREIESVERRVSSDL